MSHFILLFCAKTWVYFGSVLRFRIESVPRRDRLLRHQMGGKSDYGRLAYGIRSSWYQLRTSAIYPAVVQSELVDHITSEDMSKGYRELYDTFEIPAERVANVVAFALSQPEDTNISEFTLGRPRSLGNL